MLGQEMIQVKVIDCFQDKVEELNDFLMEYSGNIVDIKPVQMFQGWTRYIVIYKAIE